MTTITDQLKGIKVLSLEDSIPDFELISELLYAAGLDIPITHCINEQSYTKALQEGEYDIILSDYNLLGFNAFGALKIRTELAQETPFIVVSGTIGEDKAVEIIKDGAIDYILKNRLERLPSAIIRAVQDIREKELLEKTETALSLTQYSINRISDCLFWTDKNANIIDVNESACTVLGFTKEEFLNLTVFDIDPDFQKNNWNEHWSEITKNHTLVIESRHKTKDGRTFPVQITCNYLQFQNKEYNCAIAQDITERLKAEALIKENEEKYRNIFQNSPVGLFRTQLTDGKILECNEQCAHMFGYACREELIEQSFSKEIFVDEKDATLFFEQVEKNQSIQNFEVELYQNGQKKFWANYSGSINVTNNYIEGVIEDITKRKAAEGALKSLSTSYALLTGKTFFDAVSKHIAEEMKLEHVFASKINREEGTETILGGYSMGQPMESITYSYKGGPCEIAKDSLMKIFRAGIQEQFPKSELLKIIPAESYIGTTLFNSKLEAIGLIVGLDSKPIDNEEIIGPFFNYFRDRVIGEIQRIETEKELIDAKEKAQESERLKTAFLQNISHEIRTPMNAIMGFSGMLNKTDLMEEKRKSFVSIIQNSSNQLLSIVDDILKISALETNQEKVRLDEVSINNIIVDLISIYKIQATNKNISIYSKQSLGDKQSEIFTDRTKITQILTNLISNALKFTHEGSIEFGYQLKKDFLEFYVKDTGIGIKKEVQDKIFERFRQADSTIQTNYGGTGLGLSISKAYIELLGGKIWVESEPQKGSTFYFTLPYKPVNEAYKVSLNNEHEEKTSTTILIAEDEEYNFLFIEELLNDIEGNLIHAKNGKEAVDLCKTNEHIDLILMDIKMPVMDGYDATLKIKEFRPEVPIIAQSAYYYEQYQKIYGGDIFDDYITKPINENQLKEKIAKYINNPTYK